MSNTMEQTRCISNRILINKKKVRERKLNLKDFTMIDPVTWWLRITQYNDQIVLSITNMVETTWLTRYPRPMEIMYEQGS